MIDNETGLLLAGEMDEAVERIDREFERLLDEND